MDALDLLGVLRRQRATALLIVALLILALGALATAVPPQYSTFATVLGAQRNPDNNVNPYGVVGQAQIQAATVAVVVLGDPRIVADLKTQGATADFTLSNERGPLQEASSLMTVSVTGSSADAVLTTARLVVQRARDELRRLQEQQFGVPPQWQMVLSDVVKPTTVTTSHGAQLRAVAIAAALGVVVGLLVLVVLDRARTGRTPRYHVPRRGSGWDASGGVGSAPDLVHGPGDR